MHQFDRSIKHLQRIADAEPAISLNHWVLASAYEANGQYAEAVEEHARAAQTGGVGTNKIVAHKETFIASGWQGYLERRKGTLMAHIAEGGYVSAMTMASVDAKLGNKDEAFTWLNKAIDDRSSGIPNLKVEPAFDSLHSDPRFAKLLQRMNLTP